MEVTFAQLVSTYSEIGILALCALMFILLAIYVFRRSDKQSTKETERVDNKDAVMTETYKELLKSVQEQNDKLIDAIQKSNDIMLEKMVDKVTHHTISPEESYQQSEIDIKLKEAIVRIRKETKGQRSCIVKYHNGGRGINGQPFLKMSMTSEDLIAGVTPLIGDFREQFRNMLGYFVATVDKEGICIINDREELKEKDASMYEFMALRNINTLFGVSIKDSSGYPIGFVCIEFPKQIIDVEKIQRLIKEDIDEIKVLMNEKVLSKS